MTSSRLSITPTLFVLTGLCLVMTPAHAQNQVLHLDGQGDHARVTDLSGLDGVTAYTLESWIRADGPNTANKIIDMGTDPNRRLGYQVSCPTASRHIDCGEEWGSQSSSLFATAPSICDGSWHHVAVTSDGTDHLLYLDGVVVASSTSLGITFDLDGRGLSIGGHINVVGEDFFLGAVDDVRIWRRALPASEIAPTCLGATPIDTTDLVSWYRFDGDALDSVGSNHAVLQGDPTFETVASCFSLSVDVRELSLAEGGVQSFSLAAGPVPTFNLYFLLGSATGSTPGLDLGLGILPLTYDAFTEFGLGHLNAAPYTSSLGVLAPTGQGSMALTVPPGTSRSLAGLQLTHAAVVFDLGGPFGPELIHVSNPVPLTLRP